jgi:hypothetical protein
MASKSTHWVKNNPDKSAICIPKVNNRSTNDQQSKYAAAAGFFVSNL